MFAASQLYLQPKRIISMKHNKINILVAAGLILMAAVARIINFEMHLYNLAPVAAIGLFGGAVIKDKRFAFLMPLLAMFIADLYIQLFPGSAAMRGFYGTEQWLVYGGMLLVSVFGSTMKQTSAAKVLGYTLAGSTIFFVVSNFGSYIGGMYGYGLSGLTTTYVMAIPFFKNTLLADMIGSTLLFGSYYLLQQAFTTKLQKG